MGTTLCLSTIFSSVSLGSSHRSVDRFQMNREDAMRGAEELTSVRERGFLSGSLVLFLASEFENLGHTKLI